MGGGSQKFAALHNELSERTPCNWNKNLLGVFEEHKLFNFWKL